ncbi:Conserved hypothetical protein [Clostridium acetobutylicum EA 2018]|uniref:Uncharacterized protein n=1 Tax=Clostridium acetobutylicum (strain ATCC 824 / DSM 792 / JCM 1419 / IAM 19013 / LMG 5710 / NBRC 13948 / NRRL B-527 / VKM B-1787 / 2291 / W) TaxID=272562 RepID=Q97GP4_CLOAB|nr:Hypothetical protein CA_C2322 [Clostridium acetobutylicum ATCC 824]ADZ21373.1 Conserved hypothetical protein [Clostridium acetobutylicum EA 2018]AEI32278.1 hypothetical protein SMB_G2356 [Clostridium acetobutylicum DSM 1731]AWV79300.1 hypothetical protein DK921_04150 [Clostridium acetobutylicum]PSM07260.1 hypothetical protein C7T89_04150 [Clostridium sp. NJ4]
MLLYIQLNYKTYSTILIKLYTFYHNIHEFSLNDNILIFKLHLNSYLASNFTSLTIEFFLFFIMPTFKTSLLIRNIHIKYLHKIFNQV